MVCDVPELVAVTIAYIELVERSRSRIDAGLDRLGITSYSLWKMCLYALLALLSNEVLYELSVEKLIENP